MYSHLVAPYWVNSDIRQSGKISYEVHSRMTGLLSTVNNFIHQQDEYFVGTWMLAATFSEVPLLDSIFYEVMSKIGELLYPVTCIFSLDKHFPGDNYHQWKPVIRCFHLSLWIFVK